MSEMKAMGPPRVPPLFLTTEMMLKLLGVNSRKVAYREFQKIRDYFNLPPKSLVTVYQFAEVHNVTPEQVFLHLGYLFPFSS